MCDFSHRLSSNTINVLFHWDNVKTTTWRIGTYSLTCTFIPFNSVISCVLEPSTLCLFLHVSMNQKEICNCLCRLWDCKTDGGEGIESCWSVITIRTSDDRTILTGHEISNNWLISLQMGDPTLSCKLNLGLFILLDWGYIWLCLYSVQIFVQSIN